MNLDYAKQWAEALGNDTNAYAELYAPDGEFAIRQHMVDDHMDDTITDRATIHERVGGLANDDPDNGLGRHTFTVNRVHRRRALRAHPLGLRRRGRESLPRDPGRRQAPGDQGLDFPAVQRRRQDRAGVDPLQRQPGLPGAGTPDPHPPLLGRRLRPGDPGRGLTRGSNADRPVPLPRHRGGAVAVTRLHSPRWASSTSPERLGRPRSPPRAQAGARASTSRMTTRSGAASADCAAACSASRSSS